MVLLAGLLGLSLAVMNGILRAAPQDAQDLFEQANQSLREDNFAAAVAGYDRCLAADPHLLKALYNRAIASEMVDRAKAIADWKSFAAATGNDPDLKYLAARALARVQILQGLPTLPNGLEPSHYVAADGDYYRLVGPDSDGL